MNISFLSNISCYQHRKNSIDLSITRSFYFHYKYKNDILNTAESDAVYAKISISDNKRDQSFRAETNKYGQATHIFPKLKFPMHVGPFLSQHQAFAWAGALRRLLCPVSSQHPRHSIHPCDLGVPLRLVPQLMI